MMIPAMAILLAAAAGAPTPIPTACELPFRVVPDRDAARKVAERVVAVAPARDGAVAHTLRVERHPGEDAWIAFQVPATDKPLLGGGGWAMTIDACTGAVSKLHRQR